MARARLENVTPTEDLRELWVLARAALGVAPAEVAKLLGVSRKTVYRIDGGRSPVHAITLGTLSPHMYGKDAALAQRMHAYATAEQARLQLPPPPPLPSAPERGVEAPPPAPAPSAKLRVQALLYVASEAMDASPRTVKNGLLAAFRHAREHGLSLEEVERELAAAAKPSRGKE